MALSDHEQHVLEQMERALASEDPRFANVLRGVPVEPRQGVAQIAGCEACVGDRAGEKPAAQRAVSDKAGTQLAAGR